jgi:DNA invertase Pin-like site-specific DNA recombinase
MNGKRTALYIRVSSIDQNPEMQLRDLEQFIAARGWELHKIYQDQLTGTNSQRPALQTLLADARRRKVDIIVCWKLDRFFRSLKDLVNTLTELNEIGVGFCSFNDPGVDMTTPTGRLLVHLIGAFAEFEASLTRMRCRAGIENARAKGKHLGRPRRIDRDQVVALRQQGFSLREIANAIGATKAGVSKTLKNVSHQTQIKKPSHPSLLHVTGINKHKPLDTAATEERTTE